MVDPEVLDKIKRACCPQKAIYDIANYVETDIIPPINEATNTANAAAAQANSAYNRATDALNTANSAAADASEAAENALDAKTQAGEALRASTAATTTANEASNVANAASTLAGTAQNRANEAYAYAGNVETALTATNVDLNNLKTATNPAIKEISPVTNTSTVNLNLTRINGSGTVAMPVASATQAGVLNANDYKQMQDYAGRIGALEGSLAIYPVTLPSDNPSSEQITNAYTSQYPDAPNPPLDNTTVSDVQRKITYRYTSIGNTWIQVSYEVTQQFTNSSPGTIKGSTSPGMVSANTDGTGSLNGYDALVATGNGSLNGLTAQSSATTISLVTSKNDGSQSVITLPQASNTQGGTITAVDYQKLQKSEVPIFTNDVLGVIKGSTEDGKISANADGTGSLVGYDQIKNDISVNTSNIANAVNTINVVGTGTGASINYVKMGGTQASTTLPLVSTEQAGIVTPTMYNQWNAGGGGGGGLSFKNIGILRSTPVGATKTVDVGGVSLRLSSRETTSNTVGLGTVSVTVPRTIVYKVISPTAPQLNDTNSIDMRQVDTPSPNFNVNLHVAAKNGASIADIYLYDTNNKLTTHIIVTYTGFASGYYMDIITMTY